MQQMNKVMDPMKTAKMMQDFEKESTKMGMTEDMSKYHFTCHDGLMRSRG